MKAYGSGQVEWDLMQPVKLLHLMEKPKDGFIYYLQAIFTH